MGFLHIPVYAAWLTGQVFIAATDVVVDTMRPKQKQAPVLVGMPLRVTTDNEIVGLSASITMTPGTLVCGTRALEGGGRMFLVHVLFGGDLDAAADSLYDMEERMAPRVKGTPRPELFVFHDYDPEVHTDPGEVVGTAAETDSGLPDLPDSVTVVDDPVEDDVIPEESSEDSEGDADGDSAGNARNDGIARNDRNDRKEEDHA